MGFGGVPDAKVVPMMIPVELVELIGAVLSDPEGTMTAMTGGASLRLVGFDYISPAHITAITTEPQGCAVHLSGGAMIELTDTDPAEVLRMLSRG